MRMYKYRESISSLNDITNVELIQVVFPNCYLRDKAIVGTSK